MDMRAIKGEGMREWSGRRRRRRSTIGGRSRRLRFTFRGGKSEVRGRRRGRDRDKLVTGEAVEGIADSSEGVEIGGVGGGKSVAAIDGSADQVPALPAKGQHRRVLLLGPGAAHHWVPRKARSSSEAGIRSATSPAFMEKR